VRNARGRPAAHAVLHRIADALAFNVEIDSFEKDKAPIRLRIGANATLIVAGGLT
jgi:hypothetical protein